jgi:hypothetical protein
MRVLLVLAVLHGLVPGLGELVESAVHYAGTGHLPHGAGETDLGEQGPEHSCGVTLHSCACCPSQTLMLAAATVEAEHAAPERSRPVPEARLPVDRAPARPFRPPIA